MEDYEPAYNYTHHDMYHIFNEFDKMTRHIENVISKHYYNRYYDLFKIDECEETWRSCNTHIIDHMLTDEA